MKMKWQDLHKLSVLFLFEWWTGLLFGYFATQGLQAILVVYPVLFVFACFLLYLYFEEFEGVEE